MTDDSSAHYAQDPATPAPMTPIQVTVPAKRSTAIIVLSVVVAIETTMLVLIGVFGLFVAGPFFLGGVIPGASFMGDEEAWMLSDQMAMDVGYLILDGDLDSYLALYDANDPHVDLPSVERDFLEVAEKAQELDGSVDYMSDMAPMMYEDDATGETIARLTISGIDFNSGRSVGGRLTFYVLYEDGQMTPTGREGRDLTATSTGW